jgi:hypothetical protein
MDLQMASPIEPPNERIAISSPLVIAISLGGVLSWAIVTRQVRLKPIPRPIIMG